MAQQFVGILIVVDMSGVYSTTVLYNAVLSRKLR